MNNDVLKELADDLRYAQCNSNDFDTYEMQALALSYCSAVTIYNNAKETLGIDADLAAADAYAKEFKLEWGYLSDD